MTLKELVANFGSLDFVEIGFKGLSDSDALYSVGNDDYSRFNDYQVNKWFACKDSLDCICLTVELISKSFLDVVNNSIGGC